MKRGESRTESGRLQPLNLPASLRPGDRIGLVAPSSPFSPEKLARACEMLERAGYHPVTGKHLWGRNGYLTGTEAQRVEDLIRALSDPSLAAVFCVRGGYGSGRLLPWLPFSTLPNTPKIFLGYSDITFLHLGFTSRMNWVTFHGPNFIEMGQSTEKMESALSALRGESSFFWDLSEASILRHGAASGVLVGGNLTCLAHLVGTPFFPDLRGALLLVEDRGEVLYRLDRLFTHLRLAGLFSRLGGLILGDFTDCGDSRAVLDMVREQVKPFCFPVVAGLPFGHGDRNDVIPFGVPFSLNTHENTFKALQHPFSE